MAKKKPIDLGVAVGDVFLDKYRVEAIIGHGGMGVVAQCIHLQLGERVAMKMLRPDVMGDSDTVERFQREAQAAAKLKSEHVARVTDVGTIGDSRVPYMVMEYLEGSDLDQLIAERGRLPVPWSVEMMLQAAEALAEAHSIGIVHRDVKPSNLFVTWRADGSAIVKVLDFGISKSPTGTDLQLTQTQSLLGTPAYMSPEQMRSARMVDSRTDIWSLGCVMYEIIEGRRPFDADSFSEMCVKVAMDAPAPMTHMPPPLQPIVLKCLAKQPDQRYASMAELGRDLIPYAQDPQAGMLLVERMMRLLRRSNGGDWDISTSGVGAPALRDRSTPIALQAPVPRAITHQASVATEAVQPRSKKWLWALVALVALGGGLVVGKLAVDGGGEDKAAPLEQKVQMTPTAPVPVPVPAPPPVVVEAPPKPDVPEVVEEPAPIKKPITTAAKPFVPKPKVVPVPVVVPPPPPPVTKPKPNCDPFAGRSGACN